jgi:hypothetical protein
MPLVRCTKDGKGGWKYGRNNKSCFTGPKGKLQAIKQGIKIAGGPEKFKKEMSQGEDISKELQELLQDPELNAEDLQCVFAALDYSMLEQASILLKRTSK